MTLRLMVKAIYLCKSLSSFILRDIPFGNVLLEWREQQPEQGNVLPEQACCSNATRVKGCKSDASFFMVAPVELLHCEHVANFAVFVCLGAIEISSINH